MEMPLRLTVPIIVLVALAAHGSGFAKEAHSQHGAHATANKGASGKTPSANSPSANSPSVRGPSANGPSATRPSTKGANPTESKSNSAIDLEATVPPPVSPPQGFARRRDRNAIPSVKIVTPGNSATRNRAGATTLHVERNAIGQPVVRPKNFAGVQPYVSSPALQAPGGSPPVV